MSRVAMSPPPGVVVYKTIDFPGDRHTFWVIGQTTRPIELGSFSGCELIQIALPDGSGATWIDVDWAQLRATHPELWDQA